MTAALAPLAKQQGVDLTDLAKAEIEFERKLDDLKRWVADGRAVKL